MYLQTNKNSKNNLLFLYIAATLFFLILLFFYLTPKPYKIPISSEGTASTSSTTPQSTSFSILFVGDIMLDRAIARHADSVGYEKIFSGFEKIYNSSDAVVGNLEGSVTNNTSLSKFDYSQMKFTFDPQIVNTLEKFNFKAVSLANNHALDFGTQGYYETVSRLSSSTVKYFGSPLNGSNPHTTLTFNDKEICLVGYHDLFTHNESSTVRVITELKEKNQCSEIIVYPHWGDEYSTVQNSRQEDLAHTFIDAGASIITGAHPHVVQPIEIYKGKPIFYSLGNHIFDQKLSWETEHGLSVNMIFSSTSTTYELIPSTLFNFEISPSSPEDSKRLIELLVTNPSLSSSTKNEIHTKSSFTIRK